MSSGEDVERKVEDEKENIVRLSVELDQRLRGIILDMLYLLADLYVMTGKMHSYRARQFRALQRRVFELFGVFDLEEEGK